MIEMTSLAALVIARGPKCQQRRIRAEQWAAGVLFIEQFCENQRRFPHKLYSRNVIRIAPGLR